MNKELIEEILKISKDMDSVANNGLKTILKAYKNSLDDVRIEIAKLYMQYGKLEEMTNQERYKELKKLEKILLTIAQELGEIDEEETTKILKEVYKESYYRTYYTIQRGVEAEIPLMVLSDALIKQAIEYPIDGKLFSDRIWKNKEKLINRVIRNVEQAIIKGISIDKLARDIKNTFGSSAYESKRLINTEVARCQSQAQAEIYRNSDVVKQVMYDATLDNKTSAICRELDGKVFDANSNYPQPPQHPNCRSAIVPVVEGWNPTKKRENIKNESGNKPIIDYKSYSEWKKSKNIS